MHSKAILGTSTDKVKMNWFEYWIGHCWMSGWQSIHMAFDIWKDLLSSDYDNYALLKTDDPYQECYNWFWGTLGEDETYPKEFLESLLQMSKDVETGKVKTYPMNEIFDELEDLIGDLIEEVDINKKLD